MALQIGKILAIVDPTTDKQLALSRALGIAEQLDAAVHAYICCYSPLETSHFLALKRAEIARHEAWLDRLLESENLGGVEVTTQVEWREDWREGLAEAAAKEECDLIVKTAFEHAEPGRLLLKTSDWSVLRSAQSPVLLVKRESLVAVKRVLIAVNPKVEDDKHRRLNESMFAFAKLLREQDDAIELHAVSAYTGAEPFTHPPELAALIGIDESQAHCTQGSPGDVIVDCAKLLQSELVVMGTVSRSGLSGFAKPNTAEQALDRLSADVLVFTSPD